jgi:hypothetical protein
LSNVGLRVDCDGGVWFNEGGRYLSKYTPPANGVSGEATRTVIIDKAWLEATPRCKKLGLSCRIEGFTLDNYQAAGKTSKIWFTYDVADKVGVLVFRVPGGKSVGANGAGRGSGVRNDSVKCSRDEGNSVGLWVGAS